MKDFKQKRFGGERSGGFGGNRGGGGYKSGGIDFGARAPLQLHSAVCSKCSKNCEVPFRPTGEKPVYCRDCFGGKSDNASGSFERRDSNRDRDFRRDNNSEPRFAPKPQQAEDKRIDDLKRQLDIVNTKLDKVLNIIGASSVVSEASAKSLTDIISEAQIPSPKKLVKKGAKPSKR